MSKSDILLSSINTFYTDEKNKTKLLNILDKTSGISLRNLEWFITNYSKKITLPIQPKMESSSLSTVHINPVSMDTVKNYSTRFADPKSSGTPFPEHLMKFKRLWHS